MFFSKDTPQPDDDASSSTANDLLEDSKKNESGRQNETSDKAKRSLYVLIPLVSLLTASHLKVSEPASCFFQTAQYGGRLRRILRPSSARNRETALAGAPHDPRES